MFLAMSQAALMCACLHWLDDGLEDLRKDCLE